MDVEEKFAAHLRTVVDDPVFVGDMPDSPDQVVCVYLHGGYEPVRTLQREAILLRPSIQIHCRALTYQGAQTMCHDIFDDLDGRLELMLDSLRVLSVEAAHSPHYMMTDSNERKYWNTNYNLVIEP